jgi:hypothetical protein
MSTADPTKAATAQVLVFSPPPSSCSPSDSFELCVNPASLDFGTQTVNTTSAPSTVTLTNIASAGLHVWGSLGGTPSVWEDYSATSDCPQVLAAGASCTFSITFTPRITGRRNGGAFLYIVDEVDLGADLGIFVNIAGVGIGGS